MDILKIISKYNEETQEKNINDLIIVMKENYKAVLKHIDVIKSERKLALALSLMTRKKQCADFVKDDNKSLDTIYKLVHSDDVKVRKNSYSTLYNIHATLELLYELLDREDSYINIVHLIDIMSKYEDVDIDRLKAKIQCIDRSDTYFDKANAIIERLNYTRISRLYMKAIKSEDYILLTVSSSGKNVLVDDLACENIKVNQCIKYGVLISSKYKLDDIMCVRSFYELLIAKDRVFKVGKDIDSIVNYINNLLDIDYFNTIFDTKRDKYTYRLEIKGVDAKDRIKLSNAIISKIVNDNFINIRDNYDFEIRIIMNKDDANIFLKVPYIDDRFSYRKGELPASISPVTASIIAGIVAPYVKDNVEVLDGFVGTGTMLYEYYLRHGKGHYIGVDIEANAINLAKGNIGDKIDGLALIKSDIIDYVPKNKADIILSNMPFGTRVLRHDSILDLYDKFAKHLHNLMKDDGKAFLLTTQGKAIRDSVTKNGYKIIKEYRIESGGLIPYLVIVSK